MNDPLDKYRRCVLLGLILLVVGSVAWYFQPGLPVLFSPWARQVTQQAGQSLFSHEWQPGDPLAGGDGLGPVFNAVSCAACHFQGGVGGGGPNSVNVTVFEVMPTTRDPKMKAGLVHHFAIEDVKPETFDVLRDVFPIIKNGSRSFSNCQVRLVDFDPVHTQSINTTALFGAGWVDRISTKSILANYRRLSVKAVTDELSLKFKSVPTGRPRILADGRVGKFGWKAQFATLKEFVAAACANEIGLGNPMMPQAKPLHVSDPVDVEPDLSGKQFKQLVAFVDTLPRPVSETPSSATQAALIEHGKTVFNTVGCAACHIQNFGGVKDIYSDFMLHRLSPSKGSGGGGYGSPQTPELVPPRSHPLPDEWRTPPALGRCRLRAILS